MLIVVDAVQLTVLHGLSIRKKKLPSLSRMSWQLVAVSILVVIAVYMYKRATTTVSVEDIAKFEDL